MAQVRFTLRVPQVSGLHVAGNSCWGGVGTVEQACTLGLQDSVLGVSKAGALPKCRQQLVHLELGHTWVPATP